MRHKLGPKEVTETNFVGIDGRRMIVIAASVPMTTARSVDNTAIHKLSNVAFVQLAWVKTNAYHRNENDVGGNDRNSLSLNEITMMIAIGKSMNISAAPRKTLPRSPDGSIFSLHSPW